jgi:transposase
MDAVAGVVEQWLREDRTRPKKQRHTAHRIYQRLVEEQGFAGAESTVRRWVREWKVEQGWGSQKAMVPLDPEVAREAEVDWGTAWVQMGGERRRVKLFVMRSRYSGKLFVRAYAWERQEMFFDAHMHAFHYYGGVFRELVYDNLTLSVKQILRGGRRVEQERFVAFRSYYTYRARFCNPGQGHEKGGVEGIIGFARRNFLVPLPRVENFDQLNQLLVERCHAYGGHRIAGREDNLTVQERFEGEQSRLLPLPDRPYENFKAVRVKVDRYCTVRIDRNRYSVPRAYVGRWVWAHIHCQKIALYADERPVAQHERVFSKNRWQIDPLHYLDLISRRVGSFESARAIVQWRARWPKDYDLLLQQLRSRQGHSRGTREFVRILGLHRDYERTQVEQAIASVLQQHCPSYESIRLLIRLQESSPLVVQPLPAELLPGVTDRAVLMSDVKNFNALLTVGVS